MKRRRFITASTLLGCVGLNFGMVAKKKQLLHHVFFWLKNPNSEADKQELLSGLKTLGAIPVVRQIHIGLLASTEPREVVDTTWQVSELLYFDNEVDQKTYQDHPIHQAFVKNYSHLWQKVVVYDMVEV
ncbi:MAG: hypothetical protein RLZZ323_264 [Bacteroidota bacterium]|jgi:hypothetical protein